MRSAVKRSVRTGNQRNITISVSQFSKVCLFALVAHCMCSTSQSISQIDLVRMKSQHTFEIVKKK